MKGNKYKRLCVSHRFMREAVDGLLLIEGRPIKFRKSDIVVSQSTPDYYLIRYSRRLHNLFSYAHNVGK